MCAMQRNGGRPAWPIQSVESGFEARMFLSDWGLHETINSKQALGWGWVVLAGFGCAGGATFLNVRSGSARAETVLRRQRPCRFQCRSLPRETVPWDEFSGRLEAVEPVEVRSRVAGPFRKFIFVRCTRQTGRPVDPVDPALLPRTLRAPKARWRLRKRASS